MQKIMDENKGGCDEPRESLNFDDISPLPLEDLSENVEAAEAEYSFYERLGNAKAAAAEEYVEVIRKIGQSEPSMLASYSG